MPLTLCHPAAVLPLARGPLVLSALAAGSMAPDAAYFVRPPSGWERTLDPLVNATYTHSLPGMVGPDLLLGAGLLVLYVLLRRPVVALLPPRMSARLTARPPHRTRSRNGAGAVLTRAWWVLVSLQIGVLTHLIWDSFTHHDGWVVAHVAFLRADVTGDITIGRIVQHLSTLAGAAILAVWLWRRYQHQPQNARQQGIEMTVAPRSPYATGQASTPPRTQRPLAPAIRWSVLAGLLTAAVLGAAANLPGDTGDLTGTTLVETQLSLLITGAGAALAAALALYAALWHLTHRPCSRRHPARDTSRSGEPVPGAGCQV
ncbi:MULTISPECIES: DUF4184 family protein [Actinomadura]|uniref:DUF4184 family protein n=1 Tax=Actinomadura yumaensis TaxID=111807 RepID=A0ABW2CEA3_9ACTN|nr:DUF4184 family protein [Actinomadura sp. J1-007]